MSRKRTKESKLRFEPRTAAALIISALALAVFSGCSAVYGVLGKSETLQGSSDDDTGVISSQSVSDTASSPESGSKADSSAVDGTSDISDPSSVQSKDPEPVSSGSPSSEDSGSSVPTGEDPCEHNFSREVLSYTTCSQSGKAGYTCTLCGYSEEREENIEGASYHDLKKTGSVAATCTNYGYTVYSCADCSYSETEEDHSVKPAHDIKTEKTAATCTQYGYTTYFCTKCSYSRKETNYGAKPAHRLENKIVSAASKNAVGIAENVCAECGYTKGAKRFVNYFNDIEYTTRDHAEADLAAMNLVEELKLNSKKSDLEKLCALKKWYCDNTSYDFTYTKYSAYDSLVGKTSVCQGYAEALCLVLPKCGIETYICSSRKLNHAWNLVKIDGRWTHTDFVGGEDDLEFVMLGSNTIGRTNDVVIREYSASDGNYWSKDANVDRSRIDEKIRLYSFDTKEIAVSEEPGALKFRVGSTIWTLAFEN